jgi:DNA repair protein RadC
MISDEESMKKQHITTKELPLSERPYEKCEQLGAEALSDAELLAIIIKTGTKEESSLEVAHHLLSMGESEGLGFLHYTSIQELTEVSGIGRIKALQLLAVAELSRRLSICGSERKRFQSPGELARRYMPSMRHLLQEKVILVMLDTKCHILKEAVIFAGTVNSSPLEAREIFLLALKHRAVFIILIHNHPSGDPTPSHSDIVSTRRIKEAGDLLGIRLMDHIIIGDNSYSSLKEKGFL